jgi:hypothetical protein
MRIGGTFDISILEIGAHGVSWAPPPVRSSSG